MKDLSFEVRFIGKTRRSPRSEIIYSIHNVGLEVELSEVHSMEDLLVTKGQTWLTGWRKRFVHRMARNQFYVELDGVKRYNIHVYSYTPYLKFVKRYMDTVVRYELFDKPVPLPIWNPNNYGRTFIGSLNKYSNQNSVFVSAFFRYGVFRRISNLVAIETDDEIHYYLNLNIDFDNMTLLPYVQGASFVDRGVNAEDLGSALKSIDDVRNLLVKKNPDFGVTEFNFVCGKNVFTKILEMDQNSVLE